MQNIKITRYANPQAIGWAGYIEPADASWIAFVGLDNMPRVFLHRDPETGAILPDDPAKHAEHIARLRELRDAPGLHTGQAEDGRNTGDSSLSLAIGERVFPLGVDGRGGARPTEL